MSLEQEISALPRTRSITINRFKSLGINTFYDLINLFPKRYENYTIISPINRLQPGETVTVQGTIVEAKNVYTRSRITIQKVKLQDTTGMIEITWFNQPYLLQMLKKGVQVSISGEVKPFMHSFTIDAKEYELLKNSVLIHTGRIVPVYPEKKGLSTKTIREKMHFVIDNYLNNTLSEWLPSDIIKNYQLLAQVEAYKHVHFPESNDVLNKARKRLSFDELFTIQLSAALIREEWKKEIVGNRFKYEFHQSTYIDNFIKNLPFSLTIAQKNVVDEILTDLTKAQPMNRFVQGDVGSGKTVVAAIAAYFAFLNGFQSLYMAPTEILAQQHFQTISKLFEKYPLKIGIQTGSKKSIKTKKTKDALFSVANEFDILIGTQALLTESLKVDKVGLVIIDEQHRFGVAQRATLKQKGINPHLLTMTATPIPRTVALTVYGELDLSLINEMPKGRIPIKTYLVPQEKRQDSYEWIKKHIKEGSQVFIICPLIEESAVETMKSVKAANKEYEYLKNKVFTKEKVGLLHGKMQPMEKEKEMQKFKNKEYDILVSTSVVEVGIDIPNATIMIIEGAERFGLAQLHQLRGRVGRGDKQSYCLLFSETKDERSLQRLRFFAKNNSGIDLAEFDLKIRGPGDIFGTQQSGYRDLKIASFSDMDLIKQSRNAVHYFLEHYSLDKQPLVKQRIEKYRIDQIARD